MRGVDIDVRAAERDGSGGVEFAQVRIGVDEVTWPKEWLDAMGNTRLVWHGALRTERSVLVDILDKLHEVGALKDPPEPWEGWRCRRCMIIAQSDRDKCSFSDKCSYKRGSPHDWHKVREVLDD